MNAALQAYQRQRQPAGSERESQVRTYLPLVRRIALRLARTLPASVDVNDLVSAGCLGLLLALERFDPGRGLDFETFAEFRIKGAILDELRSLDPLSRRERQQLRRVEALRRQLRQELGREPSDEEMARELDLDLAGWQRLSARLGPSGELSLMVLQLRRGEGFPAAEDDLPDQQLQRQRLRRALVEALQQLPERLRTVVSLYYYARLNYREIASLLGVTESRVCQLHRKAVVKIRNQLAARRSLPGGEDGSA
ncbi:MAG: RNA polymerase sigma factor FliA [Deltaproteobacteria bacterium]|nr:MAG: RNA polymerase sigma factor FliA [Deltaproteobacteria bacterium]